MCSLNVLVFKYLLKPYSLNFDATYLTGNAIILMVLLTNLKGVITNCLQSSIKMSLVTLS